MKTLSYSFAAGILAAAQPAGAALLNYWPLNETSGTTAANTVAGAPPAELFPGADWVADPLRGQVLGFDGDNGYAEAGLLPALELETSFTWAFWANSAQPANNNIILGNRYPDDGWVKFTTAAFEFRDLSGSFNETIDYPDFAVDAWVHHAVVKNGQLFTYYRNGVAIANNWNNAELPADRPFYFGGDTTNENWQGLLDDVATWTNPLSPAAVAGIYTNKYTPANAPVTDAPPALATVFSDNFSGDLSQWDVTARGLENNNENGYDDPEIVDGAVTLGGTSGAEYWFGRSLETVEDFDSRVYTEVSVKRVALTGDGTAYRSSVWIRGDDGHYFHFSQNAGETGWSFNARDDGGAGGQNPTGGGTNLEGLDPLDGDEEARQIKLRLIPTGVNGGLNVEAWVDGVLYNVHGFTNFPPAFKVVLTGQARATGDFVSATFDDVLVAQQDTNNEPPVFTAASYLLPTATAGTAYSANLASFASDPEGGALTFSRVSGPAWVNIAANGALTGTPDARLTSAPLVVRVTDAAGADATASVLFRVNDPAAPAPPLFGWWPLNETSGGFGADISGGGNRATVFNAETGGLADDGSVWAEDPEFGRVISFNGEDGESAGRAVAGDPPTSGGLPVMDLSRDFTWSFWAKSAQAANNDIILGNRYNAAGAEYGTAQFTKFTGSNFEWYLGGTAQHIDYPDIEQDVWAHHVVVKDGNALFYYRNGELIGGRTISLALTEALPLNFGGGPNGVEAWSGYLHDVRLFNGALSETGVTAVNASRGQFAAVSPTFTASFNYLPAAAAGTPLSRSLATLASDPQNDPLTFSKESGPDWLTVSANGTLGGTPAAATALVTAVVKVVDPSGNAATATFTFRVENPAVPAPVAFGAWPLNEGSGATARDTSGNSLNAEIFNVDDGGLDDTGSAWINDPERGTVLSFEGTDATGAYATAGGDLPVMDLSSSFTWAFWAKPDQGAGNDIILGNRYDSSGGDFAPVQFVKFTSSAFEWYLNGVQEGIDYADLEQGVWAHHAVVKDGNSLFYYRNGALTGQRVLTIVPTESLPIHFGGGANGVENWRGALSDVRLFEGALSEAAVAALATGNGGGNTGGLVVSSASIAANRAITLQWNGDPAKTYIISASKSTTGFTAVGEVTGTSFTFQPGNAQFNTATEPRLFFRVAEKAGQ